MIAIVEKDHTKIDLLVSQIKNRMQSDILLCSSVNELQKEIKKGCSHIDGLLLNINAVKKSYTPLKDVPTIIISENIPISSKMMLMSQNLLDIVPNYKLHNCKYILRLLQRSRYREKLEVLIVDEEPLMQSLIRRNINSMGINAKVLDTGSRVVETIRNYHNIHVLFVDNRLKDIDTKSLVKEVREYYNKLELTIICLMQEGHTEEEEVALLHAGANDCIVKRLSTPTSLEQFQARVLLSIRQVISYLEMKYMAQRDSMTGAFNRRYFSEVGESVFSNYLRGNVQIAVAMLDIDNFKSVNDTYGHPMGDRAIISLYNTLIEKVRKTDIVSRFGGEEFCILLIGSEIDHAEMVLERIRSAVENLIISDGECSFSFTISVGLTIKKQDTLEKMILTADKCLYEAKECGKNRVVVDS